MKKGQNNHAFIDAQNVYKDVERLGWRLDWKRFRTYLREKYAVTEAYFFIGYISSNKHLYDLIRSCGYHVIFKPVVYDARGAIKGNVDSDIILHALVTKDTYDEAVVVSSDGDYHSLATHLYTNEKLKTVISPHRETCSLLLKRAARGRIQFLDAIRDKVEYKRKSTA